MSRRLRPLDGYSKEGLDFSPDGLGENIPDSCAGLDIDAISAIPGAGVIVEDASYGFVRFEPGYLSCNLKSQQTPDVSWRSYISRLTSMAGTTGRWSEPSTGHSPSTVSATKRFGQTEAVATT